MACFPSLFHSLHHLPQELLPEAGPEWWLAFSLPETVYLGQLLPQPPGRRGKTGTPGSVRPRKPLWEEGGGLCLA